MSIIASLIRPSQPVPTQYRSTFYHLYMDIAWYGLVSGSVVAFLSVYATRIGATGQEIGLFNALPAVISLLFTLPAGQLMQRRPLRQTVFRVSIIYRVVYLVWIILPWLFAQQFQVRYILLFTLISSIPLTYVNVGFNVLFADAVPAEWRGHVAGIRNVAFALTSTLTSLACGWILNRAAFPTGYQIVFGIGFGAALMSSLHLYFVHPLVETGRVQAFPVEAQSKASSLLRRGMTAVRCRAKELLDFRLDVLRGPFARVLGLLFFFHLAQYLPVALFPIMWVNTLKLSDQALSMGTAANSAAIFLGSLVLARVCSRWGYQKVTGLGIVFYGLYPILLNFSHSVGFFILISLLSGLSWSMAGGALYNYLLDNVPQDERPPYLAWYNLGLNAAVLIASVAGPWIAGRTGFLPALILFGAARSLAGVAIYKTRVTLAGPMKHVNEEKLPG